MGLARRGVLGVLAALVLVIVPTSAVAGAAPGENRYVALGDSWAAGAAVGDAEAASGSCRRSPRAYPTLLARVDDETAWTSRACASTAGGGDGQLSSLSSSTEIVTATVGSDATGLGALAAACSSTGTTAACDAADARFDRALAALPRALDTSLAAIRARAPRAATVLTGYPLLAEGLACAAGPADAARAQRLDRAVIRLDDVLAARAATAGVRYVDVRAAFAGHGVCSASPWLTPTTGADRLLAGGPSATGQARGFAAALDGVLETSTPAPPADGRSLLDVPGDLVAPLFG